jgi:hypothetical protein
MMRSLVALVFLAFVSFVVRAELASIDDSELADVTGQSGVYLSGEVSINENGGPLANGYFGDCADATKVCGARISVQTEQNGGWFVLDNIRGSIAFEGLTFQIREINSGFGGDGALFNAQVVEIGLPGTLRFDDFEYTLATSSTERPDDPGFQQVEIMGVEMSGDVTLEGNLLIFPTP